MGTQNYLWYFILSVVLCTEAVMASEGRDTTTATPESHVNVLRSTNNDYRAGPAANSSNASAAEPKTQTAHSLLGTTLLSPSTVRMVSGEGRMDTTSTAPVREGTSLGTSARSNVASPAFPTTGPGTTTPSMGTESSTASSLSFSSATASHSSSSSSPKGFPAVTPSPQQSSTTGTPLATTSHPPTALVFSSPSSAAGTTVTESGAVTAEPITSSPSPSTPSTNPVTSTSGTSSMGFPAVRPSLEQSSTSSTTGTPLATTSHPPTALVLSPAGVTGVQSNTVTAEEVTPSPGPSTASPNPVASASVTSPAPGVTESSRSPTLSSSPETPAQHTSTPLTRGQPAAEVTGTASPVGTPLSSTATASAGSTATTPPGEGDGSTANQRSRTTPEPTAKTSHSLPSTTLATPPTTNRSVSTSVNPSSTGTCSPITLSIQLESVTSTTIQFSWKPQGGTGDSPYTVRLLGKSGEVEKRILNETSTAFENLLSGHRYQISVDVSACSKNVSTSLTVQTAAEVYSGITRITSEDFNPAYQNKSSREFMEFETKFIMELTKHLPQKIQELINGRKMRIVINSIEEGSVIVRFDTVLDAEQNITKPEVSDAFTEAFNRSTVFKFDLNRTVVEARNSCQPDLNDCDQNAACTAEGATYSCQCNEGFTDKSPQVPGRVCQQDLPSQQTTPVPPGTNTTSTTGTGSTTPAPPGTNTTNTTGTGSTTPAPPGTNTTNTTGTGQTTPAPPDTNTTNTTGTGSTTPAPPGTNTTNTTGTGSTTPAPPGTNTTSTTGTGSTTPAPAGTNTTNTTGTGSTTPAPPGTNTTNTTGTGQTTPAPPGTNTTNTTGTGSTTPVPPGTNATNTTGTGQTTPVPPGTNATNTTGTGSTTPAPPGTNTTNTTGTGSTTPAPPGTNTTNTTGTGQTTPAPPDTNTTGFTGSTSNSIFTTTFTSAPCMPLSIEVQNVTAEEIQLSWTSGSKGSLYNISVMDGKQEINKTTIKETKAVFNHLLPGHVYNISVAVSSCAENSQTSVTVRTDPGSCFKRTEFCSAGNAGCSDLKDIVCSENQALACSVWLKSQKFNNTLYNSDSEDYKTMAGRIRTDVVGPMRAELNNDRFDIVVLGFRAGSVVVDFLSLLPKEEPVDVGLIQTGLSKILRNKFGDQTNVTVQALSVQLSTDNCSSWRVAVIVLGVLLGVALVLILLAILFYIYANRRSGIYFE